MGSEGGRGLGGDGGGIIDFSQLLHPLLSEADDEFAHGKGKVNSSHQTITGLRVDAIRILLPGWTKCAYILIYLPRNTNKRNTFLSSV